MIRFKCRKISLGGPGEGARQEGGEGHRGKVGEAVEGAGEEGGRDPEGAGHQGRRGEPQSLQLRLLQTLRLRTGITNQSIN